MKTEVKIAIIVGAIALTGCILAFIINYRHLHPKEPEAPVEVLKHIWIDEDKGEGTYVKCSLSDSELAKINVEMKKVFNLTEESKVTDKATLMAGVTGEYKVKSGSNFIAFDSGKNIVYRSSDSGIYNFRSDMYKDIELYCSSVTRDNIVPNEE